MSIEDLIVNSGANIPNLSATYRNAQMRKQEMGLNDIKRNALIQSIDQGNTQFSNAQTKFSQEQADRQSMLSAQEVFPVLDQAMKIDPAQRKTFLAQALPRMRSLDPEDRQAFSDLLNSDDNTFNQYLPVMHQHAASILGQGDTENTVQSTHILDNGNIGIVKRDGQVVDTGKKAKPPNYVVSNIGGVPNLVNPSQTTGAGDRVIPLSTPEQEITAAANKERATTQAKGEGKTTAEREATKPQQQTSLSAKQAKVKLLNELIDQAKMQAGTFTTGFIGGLTQSIPGSPAHDLSNTLDTIKSNIGFDKLQEMRDSSPTGGALGQVSERENTLLQSVWGALLQSQSEKQFKVNLERVRRQVKESWDRVARAYEDTYGEPIPEDVNSTKVDDPLGIRR